MSPRPVLTEHPLVRNRSVRDAALACGHALESAACELGDAIVYAEKVPSPTTEDAVREALLCVKRAREFLAITFRRLPQE